ncbi:MAG: ArsR family transcriptional regulator [Candidatus Micrarchaeota archaeon]|nr:ArsR family transcriptional regulator [Candidatus Micrarchaeota archaeon]
MSKTWETKKRILKLVSKGQKTPGEISQELGLAPSTVSEHIEELEQMGAITQVDNPFVKKWKYYRHNPDFDVRSLSALKRISNIPQIVGALAILLGVVALFVFGIPALSAVGVGNSVVFSLTDPPSVPSGTQALNVSYSSLQAHYVTSGNTSAWVSGTGSGNLDLMSLVNASQVIGTGKVPANSTINLISFTITSAYIVINGTRYSVTVPSGKLTVPVTGGRVSANSSVLIDMSPVVTTIYTDNSTVFVLVPSVKAVLVGSANVTAHIGERHELTEIEHEELNATVPSISITSESFKVINNATTKLSITVKDNANQSITLRHVVLFGLPSVFVSPLSANSAIGAEIDAPPSYQGDIGMGVGGEGDAGAGAFGLNASANASANADIGMHTGMMQDVINGIHVLVNANETSNSSAEFPMMSAADNARLDTLVRIGADVRSFRVLNFIVTTNGTLELPFIGSGCYCTSNVCPMEDQASIACIEDGGNGSFGYTLQPGASVTLNFTGQIEYANGHIRITPVQGSQWELVVQGEEGARASTNVTVASG